MGVAGSLQGVATGAVKARGHTRQRLASSEGMQACCQQPCVEGQEVSLELVLACWTRIRTARASSLRSASAASGGYHWRVRNPVAGWQGVFLVRGT